MAKLFFYYASMNAGKSTKLLQVNYNYREMGKETLIFVPAIGKKGKKGIIHSRIDLQVNGIAIDSFFNIFDHVKRYLQKTRKKLGCIFLDESQFLTKNQVKQLTDIVDFLGISVLAYGLRTDFKGEVFEGSLYLLAWAEELCEIKSICHCGKKATMTMRCDHEGNKIKEGPQINIEKTIYVAVCREHHKIGKSGKVEVIKNI